MLLLLLIIHQRCYQEMRNEIVLNISWILPARKGYDGPLKQFGHTIIHFNGVYGVAAQSTHKHYL